MELIRCGVASDAQRLIQILCQGARDVVAGVLVHRQLRGRRVSIHECSPWWFLQGWVRGAGHEKHVHHEGCPMLDRGSVTRAVGVKEMELC